MRSRLIIATLVSLTLVALGAQTATASEGQGADKTLSCRPKGANCKVMNGNNPEGKNELCCSSHCNWDNGAQNFLCD
jgi:hypothetical protein